MENKKEYFLSRQNEIRKEIKIFFAKQYEGLDSNESVILSSIIGEELEKAMRTHIKHYELY
ncbi:hypothetical protein [Peptostreptococcus faecalis]|uniref:hypothetical protein n=1 Tax=Peptostreptococcus faecalis TaxID=2045015 RepID=UPI000C7B5CAE|nr:hypothetical protein [Peptostreptococcus faecalis]